MSTDSVRVARGFRPARRVLIAAAVWLVVALVFVTQNYVGVIARHEQPRWMIVAGFELEYWFVFFVATPFFAVMAKRFPLGGDAGGKRWRNAGAQVVGCFCFSLFQPAASGPAGAI